ncbi:MAG TPA: hypothetical protein VMT17_14640 [Anaeromyxobacteraceae bacterium]|nr:hypothetical protein [Anaeromyxobacteraceae bacterium]
MPLEPEFVADCPYGPGGLLIDEVLEVDRARGLVVARMPTTGDLPLTHEQRNHPVLHPPHLNGGLLVHMTGMLGFVHAWYVLGLRHRDGWVGYGARIHSARFHGLARLGEPLLLRGVATQVRRGEERVLARYTFEFSQGGTLVYEGDQTAMWVKVAQPR